MLRINIEDYEDGFNVDIKAEGTPEMIAQQLHSVIAKITKQCPQVIDLMAIYSKMDAEEN